MILPTLRLLTQPILQSAIAMVTIGATALILGRRAETKLARIPVVSERSRRSHNR